MDSRVLDFLRNNRVSVLSVLQNDSKIHSATLHFALSKDLVEFILLTKRASRKCKSLLDGSERNASLVVGFDEKEFSTFQSEGKAKIVSDPEELDRLWSTYSEKYPDRTKRKDDEDYVLLKYTTNSWSYSNLKSKDPILINSES